MSRFTCAAVASGAMTREASSLASAPAEAAAALEAAKAVMTGEARVSEASGQLRRATFGWASGDA